MNTQSSSQSRDARELLQPVHARLVEEVRLLRELLASVDGLCNGDEPLTVDDADLETALSRLADPQHLVHVKQTSRMGALTPSRAKNRKRVQNIRQELAERLARLHSNLVTNELGEPGCDSRHSALRDHLIRYCATLNAMSQALEPMRYGSDGATALYQVAQLLKAARSEVDRLAQTPLSNLDFHAASGLDSGSQSADSVLQGNSADQTCATDANGKEAVMPTDMASSIRHFANPGPAFEEASGLDCGAWEKKAKAIAFYLPQFYPFDQNDRWWGKGFTEWRNVSRGAPRFAGHYQPRIPRDLGFYSLTDATTLRQQCELARVNGIEAFCFYYYWFNGERLMDKPLDLFVEEEMPQDFCLMWANENWTRTWDGFDSEVLIEQNYRDEDEEAFIADTARYMANPRYVHVDDRPLFILYRPGLLPDAKETLARWRSKWTDVLGIEPWILMVQGFGDMDPREYGLDGAVEFPPHKVTVDTSDINSELMMFDPGFEGHVRRYEDVIENSLTEGPVDFPLIKTVSPHWDNDARREGRGLTLHGSTPQLYQQWLEGVIEYAVEQPFQGEPLVFINAWNEWAEGAYLEPDVHYGHAYLNATQKAVHGLDGAQDRRGLLLVGDDANQGESQQLLLTLATVLKQQFGLHVLILLNTGGALLADYRALTHTVLLEQSGQNILPELLAHHVIDGAIMITQGVEAALSALGAANVPVVALDTESSRSVMAMDEYAFSLLQQLDPELRKVSVVVPNYNYAQYMDSRLGSIFAQRYPIFETVVLDDCSTDDSLETIEAIVARSGRIVRIDVNDSNSGNVFRQWKKGLELARGDFCWIAEADDLADPDFLLRSASAFGKHTVMSCCDSVQIDTEGGVLAESYDYYLRRVDEQLFSKDFSLNGAEFARRALSVLNVILNVSAVLWEREALEKALLAAGSELENYKLVGDWRLYLDVLASDEAEIVWCNEALNTHRRHPESVTHSLDSQRHLDEVVAMHDHAKSLYGQSAEVASQVMDYQEELRAQFGLKRDSRRRAS